MRAAVEPELNRSARLPSGVISAGFALLVLTSILLFWPLAGVGASAFRSTGTATLAGPSLDRLIKEVGGYPGLLLRTLGVAGLISLLACIAALPAAWVLRRCSRLELALSVAPLLTPSYLVYSAFSTLREQGSWLGDLLGRAPTWVPALVGQWLAVGGMVLWVWPLPALLMALGLARVSAPVMEALELDGASAWGRAWQTLIMSRAAVVHAFLATFLLMVGSAVPLHLAQVQTHAILLWKCLDLLVEPWRVWLLASPLVLLGVFAGELIARRIAGAGDEGGAASEPARAARWPARGQLGLLLGLSVVAPLGLFAMALKESRLLRQFWRDDGAAVVASALVALGVAAGSLLLTLLVWAALGAAPRPGRFVRFVAGTSLRAFLAAGLIPGVLVGSAVAAAWGRGLFGSAGAPLWVMQAASGLMLVAAHLARFGFLAVGAGWLLHLSESRELRDLRHMESSDLRSWWSAAAAPQIGAAAGVALACAALSFNEIESSVMVQPPGIPSMARSLLEHLHYLRDQQVAAAAINVMSGGVLVALLAAWLAAPRAGLVSRAGPSAVS